MLTIAENPNHERLKAGVPTLAVHMVLALALFAGLDVGRTAEEPAPPVMSLLDLIQPPPPRPIANPNPTERQRRREGAASPPNLEERRSELIALPSPLPPPPQPLASPKPETGLMPDAGSARIPGPGTGSGGFGTGTGSGRYGDGPGGGGDGDGDGGGFTPPRRIRGQISDRDYPRGLGEAGVSGIVAVIYTVETDGRATNCRITGSSGSPELDDHTCRLIEQRFRFRPSMDRRGRPVRSRIVQDHYWDVEDDPEEEERVVRRRRRLF